MSMLVAEIKMNSLRFLQIICLPLFCTSLAFGQNPPSRPILFAHGYCGSAFDFQPLIASLQQQLPQNLYPDPTVYYVAYDSLMHATTFYLLAQGSTVPVAGGVPGLLVPVPENTIPRSTRFFSILFAGPDGKSTLDTDVANVSILNKANELAHVINRITAITTTKNVIVIGHSMGGLDARAYVENLASTDPCYNNEAPAYNAQTCKPGSTPYANDVADLITIDTPHFGSPFAGMSLNLADTIALDVLDPSVACIFNDSVNHAELEVEKGGGAGLIEAMNYNGSLIHGIEPTKNTTLIQAIEDYFNDTEQAWDGLTGYSDDIVQQRSQSIVWNLPPPHSTAVLQDLSLTFSSTGDPGINNTAACWVLGVRHKPMLHYMTCLGAQAKVQSAVASLVVQYATAVVSPTNLRISLQ